VSVRQKQGFEKKYNPDGWRFFGKPERPGLAFASGHGVTFAPEIRQQHTGSLIKEKREAIGILGTNIARKKSSHHRCGFY